MKKFTKLLAVLLAIAVIVCPMVSALSVSADATPSGTYKLEQVDGDTVRLTINSTDGFLVYKAVITTTVGTLSNITVADYTLKGAEEKDAYNYPAFSTNTVGNATTILVSATDSANLDLYTQVVITMDVTTGSNVAITNIQAADEGDVETDPTLLGFPGVEDASDGEINTEAPDYPAADAEIENVHTHSFTTTPSTSQASAATCTANQFMWAKCDNCDAISDSVKVENAGTKLGHNFTDATDTTDIKEEANCLHGTIYYMGCTRCDATAKGNNENATWTDTDVTDHTWGAWGETTGATCTEDGTHTRSCTVVGCTATDTTTVTGSKLGHSFINYVSNNDATCIADGTKTAKCERCTETDTVTDEGTMKGHSFINYVSNNDATCKDDGTKTAKCERCTETDTVTDVDSHLAVAHTFVTYVYNNDASCTKDGTKTATCTVCETATDTVDDPAHPKTGHDYQYAHIADSDPSQHTVTCSRCDLNETANCSTNVEGETCAQCNFTIPSAHHFGELKYKAEGGKCVTYRECTDDGCNEVEIVADLTPVSTTKAAVTASGLSIKFRMKKTDVTGYTNIYGLFNKDVYSANTLTGVSEDVLIEAVTETVSKVDRWTCEYAGIASYEMTSAIHGQIFGTDNNGNVILLTTIEYSFVDFLTSSLASPSSITKYKTFYASIAMYGASSQNYAGYHTAYMPTKDINVADYMSTDLPSTFNTTNVFSGIKITAVPVMGNNIKIRYRVTKTDVTAYEVENLKFVVSYTDAYNVAQTITIYGSSFTTNDTGTSAKWQAEFDALVCAHYPDSLTVKLYDGTNEIGSLAYGLEDYAATAYKNYFNTSGSNKKLCTLAQAAVAYGRAAAQL